MGSIPGFIWRPSRVILRAEEGGWPLGEPEQGSIQIPDGSTGGRDNRTGAVCAYGCGGPYLSVYDARGLLQSGISQISSA